MSSEPLNPSLILNYIEAFRRSKTMFTAVRLGVFDELERASQTAIVAAASLQLNVDALSRLLDACVALQLLERAGPVYRNTALASQYLVSSSPQSLAGYIEYSDQSLFELWFNLGDAVREGSNRWAQTFGSRNALFDHYFRDESATASFLGGMHGFGQISSAKLVRAFDLSRFRHLVDLGGATGHLAIAACEAYGDMRATVVDLAPVIPFARKTIAASAVSQRIEVITLDFFADPLPPADLYALGRILHDWGEDRIRTLLAKICKALPPGGGLLITEKLLDEDRTGPLPALMQDLNMLVCTDGKERTQSEYDALLYAAGFGQVAAQRTGVLVDAILATKSD